jgi:hypothetical protein
MRSVGMWLVKIVFMQRPVRLRIARSYREQQEKVVIIVTGSKESAAEGRGFVETGHGDSLEATRDDASF